MIFEASLLRFPRRSESALIFGDGVWGFRHFPRHYVEFPTQVIQEALVDVGLPNERTLTGGITEFPPLLRSEEFHGSLLRFPLRRFPVFVRRRRSSEDFAREATKVRQIVDDQVSLQHLLDEGSLLVPKISAEVDHKVLIVALKLPSNDGQSFRMEWMVEQTENHGHIGPRIVEDGGCLVGRLLQGRRKRSLQSDRKRNEGAVEKRELPRQIHMVTDASCAMEGVRDQIRRAHT